MSEPPLLFATGLFLVALGLLLAVLTRWLSSRLAALRLPVRRTRYTPRHAARTASARAASAPASSAPASPGPASSAPARATT